jgi:hypothetical protein
VEKVTLDAANAALNAARNAASNVLNGVEAAADKAANDALTAAQKLANNAINLADKARQDAQGILTTANSELQKVLNGTEKAVVDATSKVLSIANATLVAAETAVANVAASVEGELGDLGTALSAVSSNSTFFQFDYANFHLVINRAEFDLGMGYSGAAAGPGRCRAAAGCRPLLAAGRCWLPAAAGCRLLLLLLHGRGAAAPPAPPHPPPPLAPAPLLPAAVILGKTHAGSWDIDVTLPFKSIIEKLKQEAVNELKNAFPRLAKWL